MRVRARGRDEGRAKDGLGPDDDPVEVYQLQVWPAPAAAERIVHQTDQAGDEWRRLWENNGSAATKRRTRHSKTKARDNRAPRHAERWSRSHG
ncbi:hypothetical protein [Streptomyces sp. Ncost-T10-10d]|uniref:hypothetical protein n=1 Tax=Streptomyces sp. Ncost-T10-10d TaxID=1839774 RepID=UPI00081EAE25|nr:hypothetical protein [Streptomyces sp. Ncost-T10-10d]SCF72702.1 hypothetical protein GA0115254_11368 [Streptomyces sp. Ncost-T10-10d]